MQGSLHYAPFSPGTEILIYIVISEYITIKIIICTTNGGSHRPEKVMMMKAAKLLYAEVQEGEEEE